MRTYLDRYPAKMIGRLADELVVRYAGKCRSLLDPFCGSGAILTAGKSRGLDVVGLDLNPYAVLLSKVKLDGFDPELGGKLLRSVIAKAKSTLRRLPVDWPAKSYWFTPRTLEKFEALRYAAQRESLGDSREGRAILLALALAVRRCSRADQRSPKPFISRRAHASRRGKHFDPVSMLETLFRQLSSLYGHVDLDESSVFCLDLTSSPPIEQAFSHVITSPPYINAQDYFRNFKLELFMLEGLLPFRVELLKQRFIGTERGPLLKALQDDDFSYHEAVVPELIAMRRTHPRQAAVVDRYLYDMRRAFDAIASQMGRGHKFIVVCGDNLVGGYRIQTWAVLNRFLEERGFALFERYGDTIDRRNVPPTRMGHKGLIKEEVVSAFRRI